MKAVGWRVLALVLVLSPAAAAPLVVTADDGLVLAYRVLRDGVAIGRHVSTVSREGPRLVMRTRIRIEVRLLFVTLYRYRFDGTETWQDGRLVAFESTTDDNGDVGHVRARAEAGRLQVTGPAGAAVLPADVVPSSLWHRAMVGRPLLLDVETGEGRAVTWRPLADGGFAVSGDGIRDRELWYDDDGTLRALKLFESGSEIRYVREAQRP